MEIGAEAALFPEKEYINGIAVAVCYKIIKQKLSSDTVFIIRISTIFTTIGIILI